MLFLKSLVSTISSTGTEVHRPEMATHQHESITPASAEQLAQFHHDLWKSLDSTGLVKLSHTWSPSGSIIGDNFSQLVSKSGSPKSLKLPKQNDDWMVDTYRQPKLEPITKPSQFEQTSTVLYELKSQLSRLEQSTISYPNPDASYQFNLDKVSGLITATEHTLAELERELITSQASVAKVQTKLAHIFHTLGTNSSVSISDADSALYELASILNTNLYEALNLVQPDQIILLLAGQLRHFWSVYYEQYQKKSIFESQIDIYFEDFANALVALLETPQGLARLVSEPALSELLSSLLPCLVLQEHFEIKLRGLGQLNTAVFQHILRSNSKGLDSTVLATSLIRLLTTNVKEALMKRETDLPPWNYPQLYAEKLGTLFKKAVNGHGYVTGVDGEKILAELFEAFDLYSDFKIQDNPIGLDSIKLFLDLFIRWYGAGVWSRFSTVEALMKSKGIKPSTSSLYKYLESFHKRPVVEKPEVIDVEGETSEPEKIPEVVAEPPEPVVVVPPKQESPKRTVPEEEEESPEAKKPKIEQTNDVLIDLAQPGPSGVKSSKKPRAITTSIIEQIEIESDIDGGGSGSGAETTSADTTLATSSAPVVAPENPTEITQPSTSSSSSFKRSLGSAGELITRIFGNKSPKKSKPTDQPLPPPPPPAAAVEPAAAPQPGSSEDPIEIDDTPDEPVDHTPSKKQKVDHSPEPVNQQPEDLSMPGPSNTNPAPESPQSSSIDPTKLELIKQVHQMQQDLAKSQELFAKLLEKLAQKK